MGVYIAHPSSRVGKDGRLYIYGSLDSIPSQYCSKSYHVLASKDLMTWELYRNRFTFNAVLYAPDMMEKNILTQKDQYFHEGSYVVKRGSWYYYTFADVSRNGKPTCIGYAMSKSPMGPYEYKGVIIDNNGCDPSVWNNHGSLVEFKDKWYVLYHRATHGSVSMRKACIEPITFREDGTCMRCGLLLKVKRFVTRKN